MENQRFDQESIRPGEVPEKTRRRDLAHRLGTMGWALFFIWVGIAFLANIDIGVGLVGIGVITLGMQALRGAIKLRIEGFWIVVGLLFVVGGIWELLKPSVPLVPVLLIVAGLLLFLSIVRRRRHAR